MGTVLVIATASLNRRVQATEPTITRAIQSLNTTREIDISWTYGAVMNSITQRPGETAEAFAARAVRLIGDKEVRAPYS